MSTILRATHPCSLMLDRVLPSGVGLHLFGVKGTALRFLSDRMSTWVGG